MKTLPLLILTFACARPVETPDIGAPVGSPGSVALRGGFAPGGERVDVVLADGRITSLTVDAPADTSLDVTGRTFAPGFIDSHVHLAFWTVGESLPATGLGGAASFLLLDGDPLEDITRAASPAEVWIDGVRVAP